MIDALCGVTPEEDFVLPDGDVESWSVNQVAGWAATKLSARTAQAPATSGPVPVMAPGWPLELLTAGPQ